MGAFGLVAHPSAQHPLARARKRWRTIEEPQVELADEIRDREGAAFAYHLWRVFGGAGGRRRQIGGRAVRNLGPEGKGRACQYVVPIQRIGADGGDVATAAQDRAGKAGAATDRCGEIHQHRPQRRQIRHRAPSRFEQQRRGQPAKRRASLQPAGRKGHFKTATVVAEGCQNIGQADLSVGHCRSFAWLRIVWGQAPGGVQTCRNVGLAFCGTSLCGTRRAGHSYQRALGRT